MAKKSDASKVTEPVEDENLEATAFEDESFDETGFEEEQIGFPPYWNPSDGKKLRFKVIALDQRDPMFWRWVLQATHGVACATGPSEEAEPVMVKAGEFFTMSVYAALPLERYLGMTVIATVKAQRALDGGHTRWVWGLKVGSEDKKQLEANRKTKLDAQLATSNGMTLENIYEQAQNTKRLAEDNMKASKRSGLST